MQPYTTTPDAALLGVRLVVAAIFLYAGAAKWPFWSALSGCIALVAFGAGGWSVDAIRTKRYTDTINPPE